jgi:hypothetical protein
MFKRFEVDFIERINRKSIYSMPVKILMSLEFLDHTQMTYGSLGFYNQLKTLAAILLNRRLQVRIL